ncbi:MAG: acyclic terpene utilization AtuA family protein [Sedimentisphaerales bacterium]|nr:acyclic terpene utilization AtuA family protein [Sedimentisphaerales bacterium]
MMSNREFKILSPTAILGYGFPESSFLQGIKENPDLIAVDAGSVDPGPYYLGSGKSFTDRVGVKRDLRIMLREAIPRKIPVIIGSAGGSGAKPHLDWCEQIIREIARQERLSFKMGIIPADIDKSLVCKSIQENKIHPLCKNKPLTEQTVEETSYIVAQMGTEPFVEALRQDCRVILAGRAYDPAGFAALPVLLGYNPALAIHLGKILECAAIAAQPGSGADCALGILKENSFVLKPLNMKRSFTRTSVAAHSLYEKSDPYCLPGPGGALDLREVEFTEIGDGQVEVKGTHFIPANPYTLKLEGARQVGYRTVSIAGSRDPVMIAGINSILKAVEMHVKEILENEKIDGYVNTHIYGKNAVMGELEPNPSITSHEIGILLEAVGKTQENANTICSIMRSTLLHYGYPGRISTAGNLAFPFSPSDIQTGAVYEFSIYHLMEVSQDQLKRLFPESVVQI